MNNIERKLTELESAIAARVEETQTTAKNHQQTRMRDYYSGRAQGQHDALEMLWAVLKQLRGTGALD